MSKSRAARLLAAVAFLLATIAVAPSAGADTAPVTTGTLHWGFKQSFRSYVGESGIELIAPATRATDGTFDFPLSSGSYDDTSRTTHVAFAGGVHFRAHDDGAGGYLLDIVIRDPQIDIAADGARLTMNVTSRELLAGDKGGPLKDYGRIPVATLAAGADKVRSADGTTTWSQVRAALSVDAVPAFLAYAAGTALDPVGFSYVGGGGAPAGDESFTAPGTPLLSRAASWTDPDALSLDAVYPDEAHGVVYVVRGNAPGNSVQAVDASTMAAVGGDGALGGEGGYLTAFDPATGTVFVLQDDGVLAAAHWTGTAWQTTDLGPVDGTVTGLTWDAVGRRVVAVRTQDPDAAVLTWTAANGAWTAQTYPLPTPPASSSVADGWYGTARQHRNLTAAPDGSLLLARGSLGSSPTGPAVLRVTLDASVTATEVPGTAFSAPADDAAPNIGYGQVFTGADGHVYLLRFQNNSAIARLGANGLDWQVALPGVSVQGLAVGPDSVVYAGSPNAKQILVVRDGAVIRKQDVTDLGSRLTFVIAAGAQHAVYAETRTGFPLAITRFDRAGVSPSFTTQPTAARAVLTGASATVALHAAAGGSPSPTLRWQRRAPGATTFTDLPGLDGPDATVAVTAADRGAVYRAVASNAAGQIASDAVGVDISTMPVFVVNPGDVTVAAGGTAVLQALASGAPEPTITWQRRSTDETWQAVGTGTSLRVPARAAVYRATATNAVGAVSSTSAAVTVSGAAGGTGGDGGGTAPPSSGPRAGNGVAADSGSEPVDFSGGNPARRSGLAFTGAGLITPLVLAGLLVGAGGVLVMLARRRRSLR